MGSLKEGEQYKIDYGSELEGESVDWVSRVIESGWCNRRWAC